ncbi:BQ2448_653 [Microbotryum intermedium]|uniref:BQ2448_653 protein n=1 Tax=Microbotryum intermedium TaxID=269621 RepID=A0A238F313_9BASI|nr:BQ2448_653 [Microbotryum intermedium]
MSSESSISVAPCSTFQVRVRPFSAKERLLIASNEPVAPVIFSSDPSTSTSTIHTTPQPSRLQTGSGGMRKIVKVLDERILVFDPPDATSAATVAAARLAGQMPQMGKKSKDIRFCFDRVFDEGCCQEDVYEGSAKELVGHVMNGFNSTVFAYGATGCGKTHTISGSADQPGVVFLIMKDLFGRMQARADDTDFALKVSYLEIYNETIRDLLQPDLGTLQLRESGGMANVASLSSKEPSCAADVVGWITEGNMNRTVNATEANATSSRSHAVLQVTVTQKPKAEGLTDSQSSAILSIIDLAGSERASVTKNKGERLIEGANINRSLLALGNCINALCDPRRHGHVPYRDSKLTRLLKPSLGGNCKTVMIVCVSPASVHYDETHNTLQYANRAKDIKTKAIRNFISVDRHVASYCKQIAEQTERIKTLEAAFEAEKNRTSAANVDDDVREVATILRPLSAAWETFRSRRADAAQAASQRIVVDSMLNVLQSWRATAFGQYDTAPSPSGSSTIAAASVVTVVRNNCDGLIGTLSSQSAMLRERASRGSDPNEMFPPMLARVTSSLRSKRPSAVPLFELETRMLDQRLATSLAEASEQGHIEGAKLQVRVMHAMCEARAKIGSAAESAREDGAESVRALLRLASGIDNANRDAFLSLSMGSLAGTKRDAGSRSPLQMDDMWSAKGPRSALSGLGSTSVGIFGALSPARSTLSNYRRTSPKKPVAFPLHAGRASASPKKQRKEVQWRDETGEGDLASFKDRSPSTMDEDSINQIPSLKFTTWASSSSMEDSGASNEAEMMAQKARLSTGPSRKGAPGTRLMPLPRASNVDSNFFLREENSLDAISMPPPSSMSVSTSASIPRNPFADIGNTSLASTTSGLAAPIVSIRSTLAKVSPSLTMTPDDSPAGRAARRASSVGPQRSAKSSRRTSAIGLPVPPPLPPVPSSTVSSSIGGAPFSFATTTRRAARVSSVPLVPMSARRSPRKMLSMGGSSAVHRRLSHAPTAPPLLGSSAPSFTFGAKSQARIAARRESSMGISKSGGSLSPPNVMIPGVRKGSPPGSGPSKAAAVSTTQWR